MKKITIGLIFTLICCQLQGQDFRFGKVSKEEVLEKSHPIEKDADAAVLYRNVNTYYEYSSSGFALVTNVHERIKIYNKEGFDWATKEILYYQNDREEEYVSGLKAYTYSLKDGKLEEEKLKKDGIFETEISRYQLSTKFTMPAVTEGSVIEYEYSLRSPFITSIDDIILQYTIPINHMEASVTIPEFFGFKKHSNPRSPLNLTISESNKMYSRTSTSIERNTPTLNSGVQGPSSSQSKLEYNQKTYTTTNLNIPSLPVESYIDHISNYAAFLKWELQYTKFPNTPIEDLSASWEGVAKSIYDDGGYDAELKRSNYFEKDIDELLAGVTEPSQKAVKIYEFVKRKMKWNEYLGMMSESGTNKAYKEGTGNVGDINLMLTAMLRYAGLPASPVLVSTKNNGVPLFPTRKGFNYVVAGLELGEEVILLDATEPYSAFGELPERARNWNGRMVKDKESSAWVNLMSPKPSIDKTVVNVQFGEDLSMNGKVINFLNGYYAKDYREKYLRMEPGSYVQILEKDKGNIEISNLEVENGDVIGQDIKQTYSFNLKNGTEMLSDLVYFKPMLFLANEENPFKADKREYPVIFDYPSVFNRTVNIMLPKGFIVESLPESTLANLNDDAGTFKFLSSQNSNFIRIEAELDINKIVYTPEDYEALKEFFALIVKKHSESVVLKRI